MVANKQDLGGALSAADLTLLLRPLLVDPRDEEEAGSIVSGVQHTQGNSRGASTHAPCRSASHPPSAPHAGGLLGRTGVASARVLSRGAH